MDFPTETKIVKPKIFSIEWIVRKLFGKKIDYVLSILQISLEGWYYSALAKQLRHSKIDFAPFGNYYEFGVGGGRALIFYLSALRSFCNDNKIDSKEFHAFAFDTFEGLPEIEDKIDEHTAWKKGWFAYSIENIKEKLKINGFDQNKYKVKFTKGEFKKSLTPELQEELKKYPPSIVTIDVDYYTSTKDVLDWLKPILQSGTLFYFDDIWAFHGNPNYGEIKAINEFNEKEDGFFTPFPQLGMAGNIYIYSKEKFEYT